MVQSYTHECKQTFHKNVYNIYLHVSIDKANTNKSTNVKATKYINNAKCFWDSKKNMKLTPDRRQSTQIYIIMVHSRDGGKQKY